MRRPLLHKISVVAGAVALAMAGAAAHAQDTDGVPSFKEFEAQAFVDADKQYVVNGDEPVSSTGALRQYYDRMTDAGTTQHVHEGGLIVNTVYGRDDKWSQSQVGNLTYCISDRFGSHKAAVANATAQGAALWENASSAIDFVHLSAHDADCTTRNNAVLFSVEPTTTRQYIARAFFPSSSDRTRNVLVNPVLLQNSGNWEASDIMGHELGHTLGFRHEHTRPEAGACFEDNNWRPLTPYDAASIMHYPQCNGSTDDLEFQDSDAVGVQALYGA